MAIFSPFLSEARWLALQDEEEKGGGGSCTLILTYHRNQTLLDGFP